MKINENERRGVLGVALVAATLAAYAPLAGAADARNVVLKPGAEHFWHEVAVKEAMATELLSAFAALKAHLQGRTVLDAKGIEAQKLTIDRRRDLHPIDVGRHQ